MKKKNTRITNLFNDVLRYRPITKLKNKDIEYIVGRIFKPLEITSIKRNFKEKSVTVMITTDWCIRDKSTTIKHIDEELITLTDPFDNYGVETDGRYSISYEDKDLYKQFCIVHGVCAYLRNNPFLKGIKNGM